MKIRLAVVVPNFVSLVACEFLDTGSLEVESSDTTGQMTTFFVLKTLAKEEVFSLTTFNNMVTEKLRTAVTVARL